MYNFLKSERILSAYSSIYESDDGKKSKKPRDRHGHEVKIGDYIYDYIDKDGKRPMKVIDIIGKDVKMEDEDGKTFIHKNMTKIGSNGIRNIFEVRKNDKKVNESEESDRIYTISIRDKEGDAVVKDHGTRSFDEMWKAIDYANTMRETKNTSKFGNTAVNFNIKLMRTHYVEFYLPKSNIRRTIRLFIEKNPK